jgi:hypothetical protein
VLELRGPDRGTRHLKASLAASETFFSALLHVSIVWKFFALGGALRTRVGTRLTNQRRERATSRDNPGRRRADIGAVLTGHQALQVVWLVVVQFVSAVSCAAIALALTRRAGLGADVHIMVMFAVVMLLGLRVIGSEPISCESGQRHAGKSSSSKLAAIHD